MVDTIFRISHNPANLVNPVKKTINPSTRGRNILRPSSVQHLNFKFLKFPSITTFKNMI